jgi:hypothetical protein
MNGQAQGRAKTHPAWFVWTLIYKCAEDAEKRNPYTCEKAKVYKPKLVLPSKKPE